MTCSRRPWVPITHGLQNMSVCDAMPCCVDSVIRAVMTRTLNIPVHAVIVEATYGVSLHEDRPVREARLTTRVRDILSRGGRVLMPVVALGRAQARL